MKREMVNINEQTIIFETDKYAKQADGAILVSAGETMVLVTACASKEPKEDIDFFPLTVDYLEKRFAVGKFPGGFIKREGKPRDMEVLVSRIIDRSLRPLFPEEFKCETQIIATVLSHDQLNESYPLGITGASTALMISEIPFDGPVTGVRVGRVDGKLVFNPSRQQQEQSDINLIMAVSRDAIVMVEGGAKDVTAEEIVEALLFGHRNAQPLIDVQLKLRQQIGKPKRELPAKEIDPQLSQKVQMLTEKKILEAMSIKEKRKRSTAMQEVEESLIGSIAAEAETRTEEEKLQLSKATTRAFYLLQRDILRRKILEENVRIDGRKPQEIRPITCEVGILPRVHGSALFTRGETQAIATATLGTSSDEQKIEDLTGEDYKRFMLHYDFPPFSVGDVKSLRAPSRREIGHGALAERALEGIVPPYEDFPYTIRIVSEILESNGSSSMATVCGGCLSLMDAGVKIKNPVAGIAMGLVKEGERAVVLSDILGDEDHLGDMDFKVAGTHNGITALQMDVKIKGLDRAVLQKVLKQAGEGINFILEKMREAIAEPRPELSKYAPRIITIYVNPDKIREVIGPGGKTIRDITARTNASIEIEDKGVIHIASSDLEAAEKAIQMIKDITAEPELGKKYMGKVVSVKEFGAFVEILPGVDGLLHISELSDRRVSKVTDVIKEGDEVMVKVVEIGRDGKIRLSRKDAMDEFAENV